LPRHFWGDSDRPLHRRPACPSSSTESVATWQQEYERRQRRDLSTRRYVDVWADGVDFTPRLDHDRQCILVLIGADASGRKELLTSEDGYRERAPTPSGRSLGGRQSWREMLLKLRDENGLAAAPERAVGDGALGFWKALHEVWPTTRQQRCWVPPSSQRVKAATWKPPADCWGSGSEKTRPTLPAAPRAHAASPETSSISSSCSS
jgi:transposase-like protein